MSEDEHRRIAANEDTAAVDKDSDPYIPCSEIREHFDRCEHLGKHQCAIGLRQV